MTYTLSLCERGAGEGVKLSVNVVIGLLRWTGASALAPSPNPLPEVEGFRQNDRFDQIT